MKYSNTVKGIFLFRQNRFIAKVLVEGKEETVHVKNTGRCSEILTAGCTVYLWHSDNPDRKTKYDLIAAVKNGNLINIDSQAVNEVAYEWLSGGAVFGNEAVIRREVSHGDSRFDFYIEYGGKKAFLEAKGVTLENDGVCMFPDAPTKRGAKHLNGLIRCVREGYEAYVLFVIQMKGMKRFEPERKIDPDFALMLRQAREAGVNIMAVDCVVNPDEITADKNVAVVI